MTCGGNEHEVSIQDLAAEVWPWLTKGLWHLAMELGR